MTNSETTTTLFPSTSEELILVTGGSGLVGSHLIQHLSAQQKNIRAIYRTRTPDLKLSNVEWVQGDILDIVFLEQAMKNVHQVYHCAAVVSFHPSKVYDMFKINVEGTANVVNAALAAGVKQLCFVSSVGALGRLRKSQLVNESMHWTKETSNSNYGKSKYMAEMEVWRGVAEGLNAVVVNPVIILGAGDWNQGSSGLFKSAYNEFPWYTEGASGFVGVWDVVKIMEQLMANNISGERYILSSENWKYVDLFTAIAKAFQKKPPHKKVTPFIAGMVWRWEAIKSWFKKTDPLVTKETASTAQAVVHYDNSKIKMALPDFNYTPIRQTITLVCEELKRKYQL